MTQYYTVQMRCPACIANGKSGGPVSTWFHANCDMYGELKVGDNAYYKCSGCNTESHVKNWRYACESHESDYRPTKAAHLANAISTAGQIASTAGRQWLMRFLDNLDDW
jgi:hypothetical protein